MEQMIEQCTGMMNGGMMGGGMTGMMGSMMGGMMLVTVFFIALLVIGVVLLVRFVASRADGGQRDALRILGERFARGEIGREEYQERLNTLQSRPS